MNDMTPVIAPKSDQLNADDLISGPRTITIREVQIRPGSEQPVSIYFEGDNNKPWRTCKSMNRVLVTAWGPDAKAYIGRSVTIYRDPKVKWGGMEVGGIRISHLSHIERDMVLALTETKGKRSPFIVKPLKVERKPAPAAQEQAGPFASDQDAPGPLEMQDRMRAAESVDELDMLVDGFEPHLRGTDREVRKKLQQIYLDRKTELTGGDA